MKKALILHGTSSNSRSNWFPWLKQQLEELGWAVWVPDLPGAHNPNIKRYNQYILEHKPWEFDDETVIIGHSSGAVEALGLLQQLPNSNHIKQCILVGAFKNNLNWPNLDGLFEEPFDFRKIKKQANKFLFIHSDDDPYCPLEHAEYLAKETGGELKVMPGQKHFSVETDPKFSTFPELLQLVMS